MKKCTRCHLVLDQPCLHPLCPGHNNDSMGDMCQYCATNQRDAWLQNTDLLSCLVSIFDDLTEYGQETPEEEREA